MNFKTLSLIMASVTLSAFAQILLKKGMSSQAIVKLLKDGQNLEWLYALPANKYIIAGLAFYALGMIVWLLVLSRIAVSVAYPFVGLGFILTLLFGVIFLGEAVRFPQLAGTLLVVGGIFILSRA